MSPANASATRIAVLQEEGHVDGRQCAALMTRRAHAPVVIQPAEGRDCTFASALLISGARLRGAAVPIGGPTASGCRTKCSRRELAHRARRQTLLRAGISMIAVKPDLYTGQIAHKGEHPTLGQQPALIDKRPGTRFTGPSSASTRTTHQLTAKRRTEPADRPCWSCPGPSGSPPSHAVNKCLDLSLLRPPLPGHRDRKPIRWQGLAACRQGDRGSLDPNSCGDSLTSPARAERFGAASMPRTNAENLLPCFPGCPRRYLNSPEDRARLHSRAL